jgi:hypothetical protein
MVATASVIRACISSKLLGTGGLKLRLCLERMPTQKSTEVLNQAVVVAKLSFHQNRERSAPVYDPMKTCRISKQFCTSGMPSGGLNGNLRTRHIFLNAPDRIVATSSGDFCVTNLRTPCIFIFI